MSRIAATFARLKAQGKKALIPFITAGDPRPAATVPLMHTLARAGADLIELGMPFSDPMADGPPIQRSSERALKFGVGLKQVLGFVENFRSHDRTTPVVLMGYLNPIERMGYLAFSEAAAVAGVDGVLVVDDPPEESRDLIECLLPRAIDPIFLLAPTSSEQRMRLVAELARGYLYYVSLKGVTGAANIDLTDVRKRMAQIRSVAKLPVGVGFGIRDAGTARSVAQIADAVVIGSRIVQEFENPDQEEAATRVARLIVEIREAIDRPER